MNASKGSLVRSVPIVLFFLRSAYSTCSTVHRRRHEIAAAAAIRFICAFTTKRARMSLADRPSVRQKTLLDFRGEVSC